MRRAMWILGALLVGCGGSSEYVNEDKVIVVPSTATMQPPYNADGGQPTRRYVVRMSDGVRDWEVEFPETASGYALRIPINGVETGGQGGDTSVTGKKKTLVDREIEANMRRNNPDMEREGTYVNGKNTLDPKGDAPGSELGKGGGGKGATDLNAGTEANPAPDRRSYVRGLDDVKRLYRAGRYEAAAQYLKELDVDYPNDPKIMSMLGTVYLKIGQEDLARQYWERVLQIEPGNREVIEALKQLNARRGAQPAAPRVAPTPAPEAAPEAVPAPAEAPADL
jgi:hypothetical protein